MCKLCYIAKSNDQSPWSTLLQLLVAGKMPATFFKDFRRLICLVLEIKIKFIK